MSTFVFGQETAGSIGLTASVPVSETYRLVSITAHIGATPTTSESLTITYNSHKGAAFDTLMFSVNALTGSDSGGPVTDMLYGTGDDIPQGNRFVGGDSIDVAFTNTDAATVGVTITMESV